MDDLERELGLAELSPEDEARIRAILATGQKPDSISEGTMEPVTVTGRRGVMQMPEEQITPRKTLQMDPEFITPRQKTIKLDSMTIDPRAQVKIGDVKVTRFPKTDPVEAGRPTSVATEDPGDITGYSQQDDQSTRALKAILADEGGPSTVAEEPLPPRDREGNALRRLNAGQAGNAMRPRPALMDRAAALIAKAKGGDTRTGPKLSEAGDQGGPPAPEGEKVATPGGGGSGPMNWLGGVALGSAPQRTPEQDRLEAAQRVLANLGANRKASIAALARNIESGMSTAYGTPNPHTAGAGLEAAGQRGVQSTLAEQAAREGNRRAAAQEQATENQQTMAATQMNAGLAEKSAKLNDDAVAGDPNSEPSKRARALALALYPKEAGSIPPDEFKKMSKKDVQMFFGEAQMFRPQQVKMGGGGMKTGDILKWSKNLPKETFAIERTAQQVDDIVNSMGGWDKVQGVGYAEGAIPTAALEPKAQKLRQLYNQMKNSYIKQFAGTAVSGAEEARMNAALGAYKMGHTVSEVTNGIAILRKLNEDNANQALAGAPDEAVKAIRGDFGNSKRTDIFDRKPPAAQPDAAPQQGKNGKWYVPNATGGFDEVPAPK